MKWWLVPRQRRWWDVLLQEVFIDLVSRPDPAVIYEQGPQVIWIAFTSLFGVFQGMVTKCGFIWQNGFRLFLSHFGHAGIESRMPASEVVWRFEEKAPNPGILFSRFSKLNKFVYLGYPFSAIFVKFEWSSQFAQYIILTAFCFSLPCKSQSLV